MGMESIITVLIALIGSAGFWSFVSMREKTKREAATEYQNTLKDQVDRLASKLDTYTKDKEELIARNRQASIRIGYGSDHNSTFGDTT